MDLMTEIIKLIVEPAYEV